MLAMPHIRQLVIDVLPWRSEFDPRVVSVGFMVDRVTLAQIFLWILWFSAVVILPVLCTYSSIIWG
jgi:hypothetical protein